MNICEVRTLKFNSFVSLFFDLIFCVVLCCVVTSSFSFSLMTLLKTAFDSVFDHAFDDESELFHQLTSKIEQFQRETCVWKLPIIESVTVYKN